MPSPHTVRSFAPNQHYHVYNRGIEKRKIFLDDEDYRMLKYYLFIYLAPQNEVLEKYPHLPLRLKARNLSKDLELLSYCLMPNHFHLLVGQQSQNGISKLMKQLFDAYTRYFNTKYRRVGSLLQGRFKAALIESEDLLLHLSRYIHLNPVVADLVKNPKDYEWSSYLTYTGIRKENFCNEKSIIAFFSNIKKYESFVEDQIGYAKELGKIKHLIIEDQR